MQEMERYAVFQFVKQGQECILSKDYVEGELLVHRLINNPIVLRQTLLGWIRQLISMCENGKTELTGDNCKMNPYRILVDKQESLRMIDLDDSANEKVLRKMQTKVVEELFTEDISQTELFEKAEPDYYGLGRTIQWLVSQSQISPPLKGIQERRLHQLVTACVEDKHRKGKTLGYYVPAEHPLSTGGKWKVMLALTAVLLMMAAVGKEVLISDYETKTVHAEEEMRVNTNERIDSLQKELEKTLNSMQEDIIKNGEKLDQTMEELQEVKEILKSNDASNAQPEGDAQPGSETQATPEISPTTEEVMSGNSAQ